ncbi:MAG: hypothetical protein WAU33_02885 [Candidatus Binataceae bacterium]
MAELFSLVIFLGLRRIDRMDEKTPSLQVTLLEISPRRATSGPEQSSKVHRPRKSKQTASFSELSSKIKDVSDFVIKNTLNEPTVETSFDCCPSNRARSTSAARSSYRAST